MLPNKQYVTKEQLERVEFEISWLNKAISRYQIISRGGKEGRLEAVSLMRETRDVHRREKDLLLARPGYGKMLRAIRAAAIDEAYTGMISIFESGGEKLKLLEEELKEKQKHLAELKKFSVRE